MPGHDIIVMGASAGGVEALREIVRGLPADLSAAIFVVLHLPSDATSVLPDILKRAGRLPAFHPKDLDAIEPGRIYVAQPDCHLLIKRGQVRLVRGPKENSARPAIDPLFRTAARYYARRVIGVVLSGTLDDGTAGLLDIKLRGGIAVVQEPADAIYSGMPRSALENVEVDHCVPASEIASLLTRLVNEPATVENS
jgi:two-component system chemotaxis response regulator CheB